MPRQRVILHQAFDVQVLNYNYWLGFRQLRGELMQVLTSDVFDAAVEARKFERRLLAVL